MDLLKAARSLEWLKDNHSHIWNNDDLTREERAGFLAACCDSRRCYLATFALPERVAMIYDALPHNELDAELDEG